MLWTKLFFDGPEIEPIEFIILLKKNRSKGVISPSPICFSKVYENNFSTALITNIFKHFN